MPLLQTILDVCGGDVAKAVQHLVGGGGGSGGGGGGGRPVSGSSIDSVGETSSKRGDAAPVATFQPLTNHAEKALVGALGGGSGGKSAFHPTSGAGSNGTAASNGAASASASAAAAVAASHLPFFAPAEIGAPHSAALANFPALRMMYNNPTMMPFLHPSYLAAHHAASSPWLLPGHGYRHHFCVPAAFDVKGQQPPHHSVSVHDDIVAKTRNPHHKS